LASGAKGRRFDSCRAHVATLPKTLAEIAIDAGLVNKTDAARAGRLAETKRQPLIVVMVRDLGVDEVALVAAMRKQMRVPLLDPSLIHIDPDALRELSKDASLRLHVLPITIGTDAAGARVMRVAMADPTDTSAIAELEELTNCELEITALPLSAVEEWIEKAYQGLTTAVVKNHVHRGDQLFVSSKLTTTKVHRVGQGGVPMLTSSEGEVSETAQILVRGGTPAGSEVPDLEMRVVALTRLLIAKKVFTEEELDAQLQELLQRRNGTRTP
jgi:Type II secretion system (T2SS), protein E, N-terminal domain